MKYLLGNFAREHLRAALRIPNRRIEDSPDDELGDVADKTTPYSSLDTRTKMGPTRSNHRFCRRRFIEYPHEVRNLAKRRREIGIPETDIVGMCVLAEMVHARAHSLGLAHVGGKIDCVKCRIQVHHMGKFLCRRVRRSIVNEAKRNPRPFLDGFNEGGWVQALFLVIARNDNGKRCHLLGAPFPHGAW